VTGGVVPGGVFTMSNAVCVRLLVPPAAAAPPAVPWAVRDV
jgi:hypothetical protein